MGKLKRYRSMPVNEMQVHWIKEIREDNAAGEDKSLVSEETLQQKEQNIQRLIKDCTKFALEVEEQLNVRNDNPTDWIRAKLWFRVKIKILKDNWWKLRAEDVNLSIFSQFLLTLSEDCLIWKSLGKTSKENLLKWQELANHATMEIINLKNKMEQEPRNGRNIFSKIYMLKYFFLQLKT